MNMYKKATREKRAQQQQPQQAQPLSQAPTHPASVSPASITNNAPLRSMDQERAEFALAKVQGLTTEPDAVQKELRSYLNGLPALIRMNGLGQALAFYRMKGKGSSHERIYRMVGEWLCSAASKGRVFDDDADVLTAITRSDIHHYMAAQNEALALLEWLKKFALALLKKEEQGER